MVIITHGNNKALLAKTDYLHIIQTGRQFIESVNLYILIVIDRFFLLLIMIIIIKIIITINSNRQSIALPDNQSVRYVELT